MEPTKRRPPTNSEERTVDPLLRTYQDILADCSRDAEGYVEDWHLVGGAE